MRFDRVVGLRQPCDGRSSRWLMKPIWIRPGEIYSGPLAYILRVLFQNRKTQVAFTQDISLAGLIFDHTSAASEPINLSFFQSLVTQQKYRHADYFDAEPTLYFPNTRQPDWLGTAFYLINACQEFVSASSPGSAVGDRYGRFPYEDSLQFKFGVVGKNLVQNCFDNFVAEHPTLGLSATVDRRTRVFLSHDIDTIYGSFLQDGLWALKRGRLDIVLKLVMNEILRRPHWKNMDFISQLHTDHGLKSTFFWLATERVGENGVKNADYALRKEPNILRPVASKGLHKSCDSSTFKEELAMLPFETTYNRYHFLKFDLPNAWNDLEDAGISLDASLGFADHYGFRNNYGLPFQPYNFATQEAYRFLEVPLNVMDGTFHKYMKVPVAETASMMIAFLEQHKANAIISILWHNTFFTRYKYGGYLNEYQKVLRYLIENQIPSITPEEMLTEFAL